MTQEELQTKYDRLAARFLEVLETASRRALWREEISKIRKELGL